MANQNWKQHHNECPVCKKNMSRHSPNGVDVIYECDGHHRHLIAGVTGEYVTLSPIVPKAKQ